jgi:hypothetical protein
MSICTRASFASVWAALALTALAIGADRAAYADSAPLSCATASAGRFRCKGRLRTDVVPHALVPDAAAPPGFGPADLASAYGLNPALQPTNDVIAVVDAFAYPNAEKDLAAYRAQYGLPPCAVASGCLTIVNQLGKAAPLPGPAPANDDWTVEAALDLDMASAACPRCKLLLVLADDDQGNGLFVSQAAAAGLGATVISNSWGGPETKMLTGQSQEAFFKLDKPVTIFVAAGDDGYDDGGAGPDYPSTSAYVVAVGGTTLKKDAAATRGWSETAWSSTKKAADGAGGSSCSISVPIPTFQAKVTTGCKFRAAADVSAVGDPVTGLAVYNADGGGFIVVGGTSASSPFVAGVYTLYGLGAMGPVFAYDHTTAFFDVLTGTNGKCGTILCNAAKGWDGPTGFGTPNGTVLATLGTPPAPPPPDMAVGPDLATASAPPEGGGAGTGGSGGAGDGTGGGDGSGKGDGTGSGNGSGNGTGSGSGAGSGGSQGSADNGGAMAAPRAGGCDLGGSSPMRNGLALVVLFGCAILLRRYTRRR